MKKKKGKYGSKMKHLAKCLACEKRFTKKTPNHIYCDKHKHKKKNKDDKLDGITYDKRPVLEQFKEFDGKVKAKLLLDLEDKAKADDKKIIVGSDDVNFEKLIGEGHKIRTLKELLSGEIPKIQWFVDNVIPKNSITILGGTTGTFKTWVAMQLALACSTGTKFLNHFDTKKCNVLYIDEENGTITMPVRFNELVKGHNIKELPENLLVSIHNGIELDTFRGKQQIEAMINEHKPDLIIIDSLIRAMQSADENKASDVRRIFANIKQFLDKCSFVILHHTTKTDTKTITGLRGSGDISAFSDVILMFSKTANGIKISNAKNRHTKISDLANIYVDIQEINDGVCFSYSDIPEYQSVIGECKQEIIEWIDENTFQTFTTDQCWKRIKSANHKKDSMYRALKSLTDDRIIVKQKRGKYEVLQRLVVTEEKV